MAQEYKEFDKKYVENVGMTFKNICASHGRPANEDVDKKSWYEFMSGWEYVIHGRDEILQAVYRAPGAEDWQKFRVGLLGLSTQQKLYCLAWYYAEGYKTYLKKIRIDNYLGVLVRGGQLNDKLEIVK